MYSKIHKDFCHWVVRGTTCNCADIQRYEDISNRKEVESMEVLSINQLRDGELRCQIVVEALDNFISYATQSVEHSDGLLAKLEVAKAMYKELTHCDWAE